MEYSEVNGDFPKQGVTVKGLQAIPLNDVDTKWKGIAVVAIKEDDDLEGIAIGEVDIAEAHYEKDNDKRNCMCSCCGPVLCKCTKIIRDRKVRFSFLRFHFLVILFLFFVLLIFFYFAILPIKYVAHHIAPLSTAKPSIVAKSGTRVMLYGDSQWGIIARNQHLLTLINQFLPEYRLNFTVIGDLGVKIAKINERLPKYLHYSPDVVLINLDSDCSNVNEDKLSIKKRLILREHYRANMSQLVGKWLKTGALVAIGGPGILGEGPIKPQDIPRFKNKDVMLDAYVKINKEVAQQYNIPFFDIRAKLLGELPWWRLYYNGYVTRDGEHPNERGSKLVAELVANVLLKWLENQITPWTVPPPWRLDDTGYNYPNNPTPDVRTIVF